MKQKLSILSTALCAVLASSATAEPEIVVPDYLPGVSAPDTYSTASPFQTTNNSGLSSNVNAGDTLSSALSATHAFDGGFAQSWVTKDTPPAGGDYFVQTATAPTIVYDLTGNAGNISIGHILLWQYQNNGGGVNVGNHAQTVEVRVNTHAEGTSFGGAADAVLTLQNVLQLGGTNSAQLFGLAGVEGRYVELTFTDNYFGVSGAGNGGDRVGIGEIRFTVVPTPSAALGTAAMLGVLGVRRRRRSS